MYEMNFATTISCEHFYLEKLSLAPVAITKHTKLLQFGPVPIVSMVAGFKLVCRVGKRRDEFRKIVHIWKSNGRSILFFPEMNNWACVPTR